jgi:hypothetical protein
MLGRGAFDWISVIFIWKQCDRETLFWLARVAQQMERTDHFSDIMNQFMAIHPKLNEKQRLVFASGHRTHLGSLRDSLHVLETHCRYAGAMGNDAVVRALESKIIECRTELQQTCLSVVRQMESVLLPEVSDAISSAFYKRLIGDCYRYIAERAAAVETMTWAERAKAVYQSGIALAVREVPRSHPLYLELAVNFAICQCELCGKRQAAVKFSEDVFNEAVKTMDQLSPDAHSQAVEAMQILRDNIASWIKRTQKMKWGFLYKTNTSYSTISTDCHSSCLTARSFVENSTKFSVFLRASTARMPAWTNPIVLSRSSRGRLSHISAQSASPMTWMESRMSETHCTTICFEYVTFHRRTSRQCSPRAGPRSQ